MVKMSKSFEKFCNTRHLENQRLGPTDAEIARSEERESRRETQAQAQEREAEYREWLDSKVQYTDEF